MYIVLALIAACLLGIGLHYLLPARDIRGVALVPAITTVVTAAAYSVLQWAGIGESDPLLWFASLGGGIVLALLATLVITAVRSRSDAAKKRELRI